MYDLIIIGGSAAGTSAAIYAARRGLNILIIAKDLGGEVATSGEIENWPGVVHTNGLELAERFRKHLEVYSPEIKEGYLAKSVATGGVFTVTLDDDSAVVSRAVIIATGVHPRELDVPGEKEFRLKGVSYCTVCDGPLFAGKVTATIGGGNSAMESALMMSGIASHAYVVNKNVAFKGDVVLMDNLKTKKNVTVLYEAKTTDFFGEPGGFARGLHYTDRDGVGHELKFDGAFVHIGQLPNSGMVPPEVKKNAFGEIEVDRFCATSVPGIFAAGDVTDTPHKQIVVAAGMGVTAALSAVQYINRLPA